MPVTVSALAAAKLQKEQALAKLRALQTAALEGRLLDRTRCLAAHGSRRGNTPGA